MHENETYLLLDSSFITKAAACVDDAKGRIWICAYAWRWYPNFPEKEIQVFNQKIVRAAKRGVDVRVILDKEPLSDFFKQYGIKAKTLPTKRAMHTKAILVDDKFLILGSHNLTDRGTAENYEASLLTTDFEAISGFETYITRIWDNHAV